jgi:uncharacterized protein with HEPN domain
MRSDDTVRLRHMIDAAETAGQFMAGRERAALDADRMLLFAVVRAIEVVGEAATKVSVETRAASPQVPWGAVVGMRNRLIHGYFNVDTELVWQTVNRELPALLPTLRSLLTSAA